jgi:hypothetical protein
MTSRSIPSPYVPRIGAANPFQSLFPGMYGKIAAFILGFIVFVPYPALSIGSNTGLQLGDVLSVLFALPLLFMSWKGKPYYLFGLIILPLFISGTKAAILLEPGLDTWMKSAVAESIFLMTLLAAQAALPLYFLEILAGIAVAALFHDMVGFWQMYVFVNGGDLPLKFLYVNPSFLDVQEHAKIMIQYEQRPFGLFPEPSSMSSSLSPWVLLWIAELLGLIEFTVRTVRWQRILFATAGLSSLLLIILSRSGHAMVTIAAASLFGLVWIKRARASMRSYLAVVGIIGIILPAMAVLTYLAVGSRVSEFTGTNDSWQDRVQSLVVGFQIWTQNGPLTLLFGTGSGLISEMVVAKSGLEAVFSVLLNYIYENGIPAILVIGWIGTYLARIWRATRFSLVYAGIVFGWIVGITLTTSYHQLLPIWFALGLFTVWPTVVECTPDNRAPQFPWRARAASVVNGV